MSVSKVQIHCCMGAQEGGLAQCGGDTYMRTSWSKKSASTSVGCCLGAATLGEAPLGRDLPGVRGEGTAPAGLCPALQIGGHSDGDEGMRE